MQLRVSGARQCILKCPKTNREGSHQKPTIDEVEDATMMYPVVCVTVTLWANKRKVGRESYRMT